MAKPGIIFFDAGGTLLDPWPSVGAVYAEVAAGFGLALDPAAAQRAFGEAFAQCRDAAIAARGVVFGSSDCDARHFWRETVDAMLDRLGCHPAESDVLFDQLFREFGEARRYRLLPGALETIDGLQTRGWRVGLISNWDRRLRPVLEGLGLAARLDPIVISCEVGAEKPDPAIFRRALTRAALEVADAVMVGDSLEADVRGAAAMGLRGVLFDREGRGGEAVDRISALTDLLAWIETAR